MAITYHAGRRIQSLESDYTRSVVHSVTSGTTDYSLTSGNRGHANEIYGTSPLIGQTIGSISFEFKGTDTGLIRGLILSGATGGIVADCGTIDSSTVTSSYAWYEFTCSSYTLQTGDRIAFELLGSGTTLKARGTSSSVDAGLRWYIVPSGAYPKNLSYQNTNEINVKVSDYKDPKPTNVQVGSRLEETDTRKMYHYNAPQAATDTTLFSSSSGWTGDTGIFTNSGDTMVWDTNTRGTAVVKSITNLSASGEWVMRFKITRVSGDLNDGSFLTIGSSSASTSTLARMQDGNGLYPYGIHVAYFANASYFYIGGSHDASFAWDFQSNANVAWSAGDSRWVEVSHASATAYTTKVYSNANFTGTPILTSVASPSSQTLDYDEFAIGTKWGGGRKNIIIEDMQIWTGVTTPPSADNTWSEEGT